MQYTNHYASPLGEILLAADGLGLTGLWLAGQKYFASGLAQGCRERDLPVFAQAKAWLDLYFSGREPDFAPPLHLMGTDFQLAVWAVLRTIPYGQTMSYGEVAERAAGQLGRPHASPRAAGGAVGHNRVSIIVPCHRVVGAGGSLTGYAGGIDRKIQLLALERADLTQFSLPGRGSAL